jgi:hypothetical protein
MRRGRALRFRLPELFGRLGCISIRRAALQWIGKSAKNSKTTTAERGRYYWVTASHFLVTRDCFTRANLPAPYFSSAIVQQAK